MPPEDDSRSIASRRDRSFRQDRPPAPINIIPAGPEVSSNRQRDRDLVPSPNFAHPSRRVSEREYDCNRREQPILERDGLPRRPAEYPPPADHVGQSSRTCLPTTVWTCIPTFVLYPLPSFGKFLYVILCPITQIEKGLLYRLKQRVS